MAYSWLLPSTQTKVEGFLASVSENAQHDWPKFLFNKRMIIPRGTSHLIDFSAKISRCPSGPPSSRTFSNDIFVLKKPQNEAILTVLEAQPLQNLYASTLQFSLQETSAKTLHTNLHPSDLGAFADSGYLLLGQYLQLRPQIQKANCISASFPVFIKSSPLLWAKICLSQSETDIAVFHIKTVHGLPC